MAWSTMPAKCAGATGRHGLVTFPNFIGRALGPLCAKAAALANDG